MRIGYTWMLIALIFLALSLGTPLAQEDQVDSIKDEVNSIEDETNLIEDEYGLVTTYHMKKLR